MYDYISGTMYDVSSNRRRPPRTGTRRGGEPVWAVPEPGARRPRYTRQQIAEAALRIADAEGVEALSMRRVAAELGAGTMTLYYYVPTKHDLMTLVDEAIMGEVLVPDEVLRAGWRTALAEIARRSRAAWRRHPWATAFMHDARIGPNGLRHFEQSIAALAGLPLSPEERLEVVWLVDDYVVGYSLREGAAQRDEGGAGAVAAYVDEQVVTGAFPHTRALLGPEGAAAFLRRRMARGNDDDRFEWGLARVLDGIALRLGASPG